MYEYNCKIVKVVDGDTVDVDIDLGFGVWMRNERVRLYGIDAPESRTRDKEEKKYGLASKKYVQDRSMFCNIFIQCCAIVFTAIFSVVPLSCYMLPPVVYHPGSGFAEFIHSTQTPAF